MITANNSKEEIEYRRAQNTLLIVGTGTILFGGWTLIKSAGIMLFRRAEILQRLEAFSGVDYSGVEEMYLFIVFAVIAGLVMLVGISLRLFIGLSAIGVSRGRKKHFLYIPLTLLMIISSILTIREEVFMVLGGKVMTDLDLQLMTSPPLEAALIELTSVIMLIDMLIASGRIRRYRAVRKKTSEEETGD